MALQPDNQSILIVANPTSGKGKGRRLAEELARHITAAGAFAHRRCHAVVRETTAKGDAERITREACIDQKSPPACVVACGGDGTIQEVANGLAPLAETLGDKCPTMGVAPAGRCNDFAHALGIATDPEKIADIILKGVPHHIDLGRANERYFCTVATLGVDAAVSSFVDGMRMPLRGTIAYLYGAFRVLARYKPYDVKICGDFGSIEQSIFLASSANTSTYGGSIRIAPDAVPTDGLLDLCLIDRVSRIRGLALVPAVLRGRHHLFDEVRFLRTRQLTIESLARQGLPGQLAGEPLELWADGERMCTTPVRIETARGAVRIPLPTDSPLVSATGTTG